MTTERDELAELLASELPSDIYACNRVWEAWSHGTMSQDDFTPANEESDLIAEIAAAVLEAGYTKPRQVTTVDELDALPIGSVLILRDAKHQPHPAQKGDYGWRLPFLDDFWDSAKILAGCESAEVVAP